MSMDASFASRHEPYADRHFSADSPLLAEILAGHERWRAQQTALVCGDERLSWTELGAASNRVAHGLLGLGYGPGDRVAVAMDNRVETVVVMLGMLKAGCCAVPLNLTIPAAAMAGMIEDARARAVVASEAEAQRLDSLLPAAVLHRIVVGQRRGWLTFEEWLEGHSSAAPDVAMADADPCQIIYSSGTTGRPKGIVHSQRGRCDWACDLALALRYHGAARTLATLPLYSNISWVMLLCTFVPGGTLVLMSRFDAGAALALMESERITHLAMVPVQFQRLLDDPGFEATDTRDMQAMMSCGSSLDAGLKRRIFEGFRCGVIELYGLTEGVITTLDPEVAAQHMASVGRPLPGTEIEIIDELGRVLPAGAVGEIVARGRILMPGYHALPAANAAATWRDARGRAWLRTGDLGRIDAEGFLVIVGRSKDMIVSGGQNIYPSDIEAVLQQHPDVRSSAVIGVPSRQWGESPLAVVEPELSTAQCVALRDWVNARVGRFQRLLAVESVSALPRNANGKVSKRELEERFGSVRLNEVNEVTRMTAAKPTWIDHFHETDDGLRIHARDYTGPEGAATVVCLHGLTRNAADFHALCEHLRGRYRLLAIEQRGRGQSDHDPDPSHYEVGRYVQDTLGLLDALAVEKPVLIGTSMGGLMSMLMLAAAPERYRAAVLNDIGPAVEAKGLARIAGYVGKGVPVASWDEAATAVRDSNGDAFPDYADADWIAFARRLYREREDGMLALAYDPAIARPFDAGRGEGSPAAVPPDLWGVFDAMGSTPLLVIRGALSDILSAATVEEMRRRRPDLESVEVPRVGHAPMLDEPEALDAIERFLQGVVD